MEPEGSLLCSRGSAGRYGVGGTGSVVKYTTDKEFVTGVYLLHAPVL
jgi:hypothetical protein